MNRFSILAVTTVSLLILGVALPAGEAVGQQTPQQTSDVEHVNAANQVFIAAIAALWSAGTASGRPGRCASASLTG